MSYKTLAKDIADDIYKDIQKGILVTDNDVTRAVTESAEGSEVSFKPFAAKRYLDEEGHPAGADPCFSAFDHLQNEIYRELTDLDIDRILNQ